METELMRLMVIRSPEKVQDPPRIPIDTPKAMGKTDGSAPSELSSTSLAILEDWAANSEELVSDTSRLPHVNALRNVLKALKESEDNRPAIEVISDISQQEIGTRKWQDLRQRVNDSLLAGKFFPQHRKVPLRELAEILRTIRIVEKVNSDRQATVAAIRPLLDAPFRLPAPFSRNPKQPMPIVPKEIQVDRQPPIDRRLHIATQNARLLSTLVDRRRAAIRAIKSLVAIDDADIDIDCPPQQSPDLKDETCLQVLAAWRHFRDELRHSISNQPRVPWIPAGVTLRIRPAAIERLSDTTKSTLKEFGLDLQTVLLPNALLTLQDRIAHMELSAQLVAGSVAIEIFKRSDELESKKDEVL
jgi:hypothetical protein